MHAPPQNNNIHSAMVKHSIWKIENKGMLCYFAQIFSQIFPTLVKQHKSCIDYLANIDFQILTLTSVERIF